MGVMKSAAKTVGMKAAPTVTSKYVREVLEKAIDGVGPFRGAVRTADARLVETGGDVEAAVRKMIDSHVRTAGVEGFVTNLGGIATMAITLPANVSGLALLHCHLVAGVAYLRGYDLDDPRVRNAILLCLLGPEGVDKAVKKNVVPAGPMALATSPVHDPALDEKIGRAVTGELLGRVGGRRVATMVGRRVPLLGGGVGAVTDAMATRTVGKYAAAELRGRPRV